MHTHTSTALHLHVKHKRVGHGNTLNINRLVKLGSLHITIFASASVHCSMGFLDKEIPCHRVVEIQTQKWSPSVCKRVHKPERQKCTFLSF